MTNETERETKRDAKRDTNKNDNLNVPYKNIMFGPAWATGIFDLKALSAEMRDD